MGNPALDAIRSAMSPVIRYLSSYNIKGLKHLLCLLFQLIYIYWSVAVLDVSNFNTYQVTRACVTRLDTDIPVVVNTWVVEWAKILIHSIYFLTITISQTSRFQWMRTFGILFLLVLYSRSPTKFSSFGIFVIWNNIDRTIFTV